MNIEITKVSNEKGMSMPVVLMAILLVTILGAVLYSFSQSELLAATGNAEARQAEYLARSGIEAAVAWWKQEATKPTGTKTFDRVYMDEDGNLTLSQPGESELGYVDVTVTKETDKTWSIISKGTINNTVKAIRSNSCEFLVNADLENFWYSWDNQNQGRILKGPESEYVDLDHGDYGYVYVHHEINGVAVVGLSGRTLRLINNQEDCRVVYPARALFFNGVINLSPDNFKKGFLIAAAEKIVFNNTVKIDVNRTNAGVLVIYVPEGLGIPGQEIIVSNSNKGKVKPDAKYGMVYFKEFIGDSSTIISNKLYYFENLENGLILFDDDDYSDELNEMLSAGYLIPAESSVAVPTPEDCVYFYRK